VALRRRWAGPSASVAAFRLVKAPPVASLAAEHAGYRRDQPPRDSQRTHSDL